jgi:hypothetical protein
MKNESFRAFDFYLANGELFARLHYTKATILGIWPNATIKRNKVYLV